MTALLARIYYHNRDSIVHVLKEQAKYVKENEPGTSVYYFMEPDKGEFIFCFEMYKSADDLKIHRESTASTQMKEQIAKVDVTYLSPVAGFIKPNIPELNLIAEVTYAKGMREQGLSMSIPVAKHITEEEKGTSSYMLLTDDNEADKMVVFEGYTTENDFYQGHAKSPVVGANRKAQSGIREKSELHFCRFVAGFLD